MLLKKITAYMEWNSFARQFNFQMLRAHGFVRPFFVCCRLFFFRQTMDETP